MKIALVYDRVNKWGGAERVLLALHELFPKAPLYTSVYNPTSAPWAKVFVVKTSFLQYIPFAKTAHELFAPLMPLAFENFNFDKYDLVISVTSEAAKGIITGPKTKHICYCLTPTRYLWSGQKEYFKNPLLRLLSKPIVAYLKKWDLSASKRPDVFVAISEEVQKRIKKYYGRDAIVIYPAVTLAISNQPASQRGEQSATSLKNKKTKGKLLDASGYFLIVSRLVPYKRIDLAIKACNRLKVNLKIVGTGASELALKNIAGETIEFFGHLTERELLRYYKSCRALLFPGVEDFGLTVLETQSLGKPVIAYRAGGALETIVRGKTGKFFFPQTVTAMADAIQKFRSKKYNARDCKKNAKRFSEKRFASQWLRLIKKTV